MIVQQFPVDVNRLYKIDEAASFLGVGRSTVYALIQAGRLDSIHLARAHRVSGAAIANLARCGDAAAPEHTDEPAEPVLVPSMPRIALPELDYLIATERITFTREGADVMVSRRGIEAYLRRHRRGEAA
jgi:excisionase family DNA binding protein